MPKNKDFNTYDKTIDDLLYGINSADRKDRERIDNIINSINSLNNSFSNIIKTPDIVEFLTQVALNKNNKRATGTNIDKNYKKNIENILDTNDFSAFLMEEKDRTERYNDYRITDAYIPQVARCINVYRDCIISPDDMTKESFNIKYEDETRLSDSDRNMLDKNIKTIKKKTNFDKKAKKWIRDGLVDGDVFVSILKIDDEINKMMLKENHPLNNVIYNPNKLPNGGLILTESTLFDDKKEEALLESLFNESIAKETAKEVKELNFQDFKKEIVKKINDNIICLDDPYKSINSSYQKIMNGEENSNFKKVNLNGCIIKTLEPEKTVKLSIEGLCIGYLYMEKVNIDSESGTEGFGTTTGAMISNMGSSTSIDYFNAFRRERDSSTSITKNKLLADLFVKGISTKLDKKIIEDNPQFKELIYNLIKQDYLLDKKVKITFYEASQVIHYKNDSDEEYGKSVFSSVMFFVRIFLATLITEAMQKISRGRDKRVVYVETGLDEDIEGSIQSVIRDFKAKEIQADDLNSITNILQQVGAFEDYYIPKIDGESPIDLETISGMDVSMDNDFLQWALKSIISGIGVPATYTDEDNQVDFSRSLAMVNSTFVRDIVNKQGDYKTFLSEIFAKIYSYEFPKSSNKDNETKSNNNNNNNKIILNDIIDFEKFTVELPIPEFLNINNVNEQINNKNTMIEFVINTYFGDASDDETNRLKQEFRKYYTKKTVKNIDWAECDNLYEDVLKEINSADLENVNNSKVAEEDESSEDSYDF